MADHFNDVSVEQDKYLVCCCTDYQTQNKQVKNRKVRVTIEIMGSKGKKRKILTNNIIELNKTLDHAPGNGTSHLKIQSTVSSLLKWI